MEKILFQEIASKVQILVSEELKKINKEEEYECIADFSLGFSEDWYNRDSAKKDTYVARFTSTFRPDINY